ncbi:MAG TPA: hypothetical protein VHN37_10140 [Actinomycetota bacterium]|nr:hypothetical protein [Actinomycetota bacterium]
MTERIAGSRIGADGALRVAALAFAAGFSVHALDHLRRGLDASPDRVIAVGTVQGLFAVLAVWMAVTGRRGAPVAAAVVGFGSALLFTYGHVLPVSLDSFVSPPRTNVTWFSWVTAAAEIGTGVAFGIAGLRALAPGSGRAAPS